MSGGLSASDVNASIPLQAHAPAPVNPLQQIGQFANIQNALNQNKLFPGQLQQQGIATEGQQLGLQKAKNAAAYQVGLPVVANPNFTLGDLTGAMASAEHNMGIVTQPALADIAALPQAPNTPAWRAAVKGIFASRAQVDPTAALSVNTPAVGPVLNNGQSLLPTTLSPAGSASPGQITPTGADVPTYPSRSELNSRAITGYDPKTGAAITGPIATVTPPGLGGPAATQSPFPNGGRLPPALLPTPAPVSGQVEAPGPAQIAQLGTQGTASANAFQSIANEGVQARGQNAVLGNMLGDIADFTPGPEKLNQFKMTLQRYAPTIASTFGLDPKAIAANESFDKLANQIAGAQGERSDARLSVAQAANPGSHLSPAGADLILRQLQGNADYLQARAKLAAQYPDQTDRAGFEAEVGSTLDPRAFQYQRMTPAERKTYSAGLSPQDLVDVRKSYNALYNKGLIGGQ